MPAAEDAFRATMGEMAARAHREVMRAGREKVQRTAPLWRRVTDGKPCGFCAMLASRGPVYRSEATARGAGGRYHDHCGCTVEPHYGSFAEWKPTPEEQRFIDAYGEVYKPGMSERELADLMDEWLAKHGADRPFTEAPKWEYEWTTAKPLGPYDGLDDLSPEDYALNGMKYKAKHALETEGGHTVLIDLDLTDVELQDLLDEVGTVLRVSQADLGGRPITFHFPRPGEDYYFIDNPGAGAYVMKGSRTVVVNPNVTTAKVEAFSEHVMQHLVDVGAGWRPRHQILTHEVGHIVDGQNFHTYVLDVAQASRRVPGDRVNARVVEEAREFFESLPTESLSHYAHSSPSEAYAEAYTRWQLGGPGDPVADAFAERFGWVRWS